MAPLDPAQGGKAPPPAPLPDGRAFGQPPEPDIPELKKKEKEKRGMGVPGYAGTGSPAPSIGLNVGGGAVRVGSSLASQPGLLGSGHIAATISRVLGGPQTFLGGIFASSAGPALVLTGMLVGAGAVAAAALRLSGGFGSPAQGGGSFALPGPSTSGIVIDAPRDRSLGYVAQANQGEIFFNEEHPMAPEPKKEEAPKEEAPKPPEVPKFEMPKPEDLMAKAGGLNRDGFIKKLTNDPRSLHGGGLGQGAGGFNLKKSFASTKLPSAKPLGKTAAAKRARQKLAVRSLQTQKGRSSRAMGQLKLAKNMSVSGAGSPQDTQARQFITDAFEQGRSLGGDAGGLLGAGGGDMTVPMGGPGITNDIPDVGPAGNVTPYQSNLDAARNLGNNAAMLKMIGMMLLAAGAALVAIGRALMGNHTTLPIGVALVAAGMALIMMGLMMLAMSADMGQAAKGQGDVMEQGYGQDDQGTVVDDCADQAVNGGVQTENCDPSLQGEHFDNQLTNDINESAVAESNATNSLGGDPGVIDPR